MFGVGGTGPKTHEDNRVMAIDVFVDERDLKELGFE